MARWSLTMYACTGSQGSRTRWQWIRARSRTASMIDLLRSKLQKSLRLNQKKNLRLSQKQNRTCNRSPQTTLLLKHVQMHSSKPASLSIRLMSTATVLSTKKISDRWCSKKKVWISVRNRKRSTSSYGPLMPTVTVRFSSVSICNSSETFSTLLSIRECRIEESLCKLCHSSCTFISNLALARRGLEHC